jgi:hypothetical protein
MSQQNFNQSMKPFCGNSNATGLFMEANFPSGNYSIPVNTDKEPELLNGSTIESIMLAKNYKDSAKNTNMKPDDIHNEYIDFIIRTALFHREIDNPTTLGSNLSGLKEAFNTATDDLLNQSLRTVESQTNPKLIQFLKGKVQLNDFTDIINATLINDLLNGGANISNYISDLIGDCDKTGKFSGQTSFGNLCTATWYVGKGTTSASNNINRILTANGGLTNEDVVIASVTATLKTVLLNYSELLKGDYNLNLNTNPNINDKTIFQKLIVDARQLKNQLKINIVDAIYDELRKHLNSVANFMTIDKNDYAKTLFEDVFMNWSNLNLHARQFYRQHLHLFRKVGANFDTTQNQSGWADIDVDDPNLTAKLNQLKLSDIRINLMKLHKGSSNVLFGQTLPFIQTVLPRKLWYTNSNGLVTSVTGFDQNIIRNIYDSVYMNNPYVVNGQQLMFHTNYSKVAGNTSDFNIDDALLVRNLIKSRNSAPSKSVLNFSHTEIPDLFLQDMATNVIYRRNDQGLYRIDNGQIIQYKDDNIRNDNCAGTVLKGDQHTCTKFVRDCIVNGDKNDLEKCINTLTDLNSNMFQVAHTELAKDVDPNMAIQILRTFDIKQVIRKHPLIGDYGEPQSFDSWKETILPTLKPTVKDAILSNVKLCDYLKGVISFVSANPSILNKNWKGDNTNIQEQQQIDDPYIRALNKTLWTNPIPNSSDARLFENQMLVRGFNSPMMAISSPRNIVNPFANVIQSRGTMMPSFGMMSGGANSYETSLIDKINVNGSIGETMEAMMTNVHDDLAKSKLSLTRENHLSLEKAFDTVKTIEKRLSDLHIMLRTLTDVTTLLKASGCLPADYTVNVSLENLKNRREVLTYLAQHVGDVQNCISNNMNEQNSKCAELVRYYSALVETVNGKQNSDIIQVVDI